MNYSEIDKEQIICNANILVVGAGGIGCELLKCLVKSGFKKITIVDLDKIEKSNLNRQFLFSKDCVGKYKAEMAKEAILNMCSDAEMRITSYVGNIKDQSMFDVKFFKSFDLIMNALDNIDARTYMNRMCIQNRITLVNSGTEGYLGYAATYINGITPCYNCTPKTKRKTIPICSIRSKPEKMEHCVAWAKALFELLFVKDKSEETPLNDYKLTDDPFKNFQNFFFYDILIHKQSYSYIQPIDVYFQTQHEFRDFNNNSTAYYNEFTSSLHKYDDCSETSKDLNKLIAILFKSAEILNAFPPEMFDKENKDIVNFVFAASNLRALNYKVNSETRFKVKEIAGNIIPAIASTNAIIAGIQTIEAIKALYANYDLLRNVNFSIDKKINSLSSKNDFKNDKCTVCSTSALKKSSNRIKLTINTSIFNLGNLTEIIDDKFNFKNATITFKSNLLFENSEDLDEDELEHYISLKDKCLSSFGIKDKDELKVSNDNTGFIITIAHIDGNDTVEIEGEICLENNLIEVDRMDVEENNEETLITTIDEKNVGQIVLFDEEDPDTMIVNQTMIKNKRRHPDENQDENLTVSKKRKMDDEEIIII